MLNDLSTINAEGEAPESRIASASAAWQIWGTLRRADYQASLARARIDALYDGVPPYDQNQLNANSQGYRTNVNWGGADSQLEVAMSGYVDILNSVETFFECPTKYGPPSERRKWEKIIAQEVTASIREWPDFLPTQLRSITAFIKHGVSIEPFNDELDWRWWATDLSDFKIPRETKVGQDNIEVAACLRYMSPTDLYKMIRDPEVAEALGYNVEACRKAIMDAVWTNNSPNRFYEWEKMEAQLKNNDLYYSSSADTQAIRVINMWVKEFPTEEHPRGAVSYYMLCDSDQSDQFLYKRINRFTSIYEAFIIYTFGVGTNGYYHGIRGQGYKIFPQLQALNRAFSQTLDNSNMASSVMVQPEDEDSLQDMQFTYFGAFSILSPGIKIVERPNINLSTTSIPVVQMLTQMLRDKTGSYNTEQFISDTREKTKFEVQAELAATAKMSVSALNLFYAPFGLKLKEVVRRMKRKDYQASEPGGYEVIELKKRLKEKGVPLEAFYELDIQRLKVTKAVGAGSEAARLMVYTALTPFINALDDEGKNNFLRDMFAEYVGYDNTTRYLAEPEEARPDIQTSIAELQNDALLSGGVATVKPNDNQKVHAETHLAALNPIVGQAQENPDSILNILPGLMALLEHTNEHVMRLSQDPAYQQQSAQMRKDIQAANEIVHNGVIHAQKMAREQQGQPQEQGPDPQIQAQWEAHQQKMQMKEEEFRQKQAQQREKVNQELAIRDAKSAQEMGQPGVRL